MNGVKSDGFCEMGNVVKQGLVDVELGRRIDRCGLTVPLVRIPMNGKVIARRRIDIFASWTCLVACPLYPKLDGDWIAQRVYRALTSPSLIAFRITARLKPMSPTPTARASVTRPGMARRANAALTRIDAVMFCLMTRTVFRLRSSM